MAKRGKYGRRSTLEKACNRREVAKLRLEGFTQEQTAAKLKMSLTTVRRDEKWVIDKWVEEADEDVGKWRGYVIAQVKKVIKEAWNYKKADKYDALGVILKAISQLRGLTGTDDQSRLPSVMEIIFQTEIVESPNAKILEGEILEAQVLETQGPAQLENSTEE